MVRTTLYALAIDKGAYGARSTTGRPTWSTRRRWRATASRAACSPSWACPRRRTCRQWRAASATSSRPASASARWTRAGAAPGLACCRAATSLGGVASVRVCLVWASWFMPGRLSNAATATSEWLCLHCVVLLALKRAYCALDSLLRPVCTVK